MSKVYAVWGVLMSVRRLWVRIWPNKKICNWIWIPVNI